MLIARSGIVGNVRNTLTEGASTLDLHPFSCSLGFDPFPSLQFKAGGLDVPLRFLTI